MRIVRSTDTRRTETPSAAMTTLASPTVGNAANPLWKVEAPAGQPGPLHCIDTEQVWTLLDGTATVTTADRTAELAPGDTVVIPAHLPRRLTPGPDTGFTALVTGPRDMHFYTPDDHTRKPLPWAA